MVIKKKVLPFLILGLFLGGCRLQTAGGSTNTPIGPTDAPSATPITLPPTETPAPTATVTPTPTPDTGLIGLPAETASSQAFDFVDQMCAAQWFTRGQSLPCPGNEAQASAGFVMSLGADVQGLPSGFKLLLTYPPEDNFDTISSKYPPFTVKKGDRFRAQLACRAHSFCDVEFGLNYYDDNGQTGLKHWIYLFIDPPVAVDYSLDGIAGKTVQFNLSVQAKGNRIDANSVWIDPHIYRPAP
jgi:hypothetical protein